MKQNKLKMNTSLTELILFGSRQQLKNLIVREFDIASNIVVHFHTLATFQQHCSQISVEKVLTNHC